MTLACSRLENTLPNRQPSVLFLLFELQSMLVPAAGTRKSTELQWLRSRTKEPRFSVQAKAEVGQVRARAACACRHCFGVLRDAGVVGRLHSIAREKRSAGGVTTADNTCYFVQIN